MRDSDLAKWTFDTLPLRSLRDFTCRDGIDLERLRRFDGMTLAQGRMPTWETTPQGWKGTNGIGPVAYQKSLELTAPDTLSVTWSMDSPVPGFFGTLLAFTLLTPDASDRSAEVFSGGGSLWKGRPGDEIDLEGIRQVTWQDSAFGFAFDVVLGAEAKVTALPVRTLQRSEKGYEAVYQGTLIAVTWKPETLAGGAPARMDLRFRRIKS
jgi:hypothetical protein